MLKSRKILLVLIAFIATESMLFIVPSDSRFFFEPGYTFKEFARLNGVKPGKVKNELGRPDIRGRETLAGLGIDKARAADLISHIKGRFPAEKIVKLQSVFAVFTTIVIFLLFKNRMSPAMKTVLLLIAIAGFGFFPGKMVNPMVSLVKFMKGLAGIEANVFTWFLTLTCFSLLSVIGTKAVCGWICPFGALQELIYGIPGFSQFKTKCKIPFLLSNIFRILLFLGCIIALFYNLFGLKEQGRVIYHVINPFNLFEFNFSMVSVPIYIGITLVAGYLFYRPHCYFVCPFGLFSWLFEKMSIFRVWIDRGKCTECHACVKACPGLAMKGIYEEKIFPADCFSCGECLASCKFDALSYSCGNRKDEHRLITQ
jgi:polyferredoxin